MSNVVRTDIDALNAVLTVTIPKEEYLQKVKKEINKYSQNATMKGFRPGKTPPNLVKKIYGKEFVSDAVNEKLQETLIEYLDSEKIEMFGQPILSKDQPDWRLDLSSPKDIVFKFDIGLYPTFEIQGLDNTFTYHEVAVDQDKVNSEFDRIRRQTGVESEVEDDIQEEDLLVADIKEVGGTIEKELTVSMNWLTDDMKAVFLTQKKGDSLQINIFQLEKETTAQYVRKYFLGLEDGDDREVNENFDLTIKTVKRRTFAELDEAFFTSNFGEDVTTEAEAKGQIGAVLNQDSLSKANSMLFFTIHEKVMAETNFDLPKEFLKRWIKSQNTKNTDSVLEAQFPNFIRNLRWTLIRSKLLKDNDITITEEDLAFTYINQLRGYFGGQLPFDEKMVHTLIEKALQDEKQANELFESAATNRAADVLKSKAQLAIEYKSKEEFDAIFAAFEKGRQEESNNSRLSKADDAETKELAEAFVEVETEG